jgi:hypothetical protein
MSFPIEVKYLLDISMHMTRYRLVVSILDSLSNIKRILSCEHVDSLSNMTLYIYIYIVEAKKLQPEDRISEAEAKCINYRDS